MKNKNTLFFFMANRPASKSSNKPIDPIFKCFLNDDFDCKIVTEIPKIEDSNNFSVCIQQTLNDMSNILDPKALFEEGDITNVLKYFLLIFDINKYSENDINIINKNTNNLKNDLYNLLNLYKKEFDFNSEIINKIFYFIGSTTKILQHKIPVINWVDRYTNNIYLLYDDKIKLNTNFDNSMLEYNFFQLKSAIITIYKIPELKTDSDISILCKKCVNIFSMSANNTEVQKLKLAYENLLVKYPFLKHYTDFSSNIQHIYGRGGNFSVLNNKALKRNKCEIVDNDKPPPDLEKIITNKESLKIIRDSGNVIPKSIDILYSFTKTVLDTMNKITDYKRIREKMHKIIYAFQNVIKLTTNIRKDKDELLQKIIVLVIDVDFLNFGHNYFIEQLKIDNYEILSIERILANISSYYYNTSIIKGAEGKYLIISEQVTAVRVNILFYIYMFLIKLSENKSFYIPLKYLNTINLLLIFCCTNRQIIYFPDNNILQETIQKLSQFREFYGVEIFEVKPDKNDNNNLYIIDIYGNKIKLVIKGELKDKLVLES